MQQKELDVLCLYFAVPMVQWDSNPTAPTAIRLWETFTLTLRWGLFGVYQPTTKMRALYISLLSFQSFRRYGAGT